MRHALTLTLLAALGAATPAHAVEPWSDDDGLSKPTRQEFGDYGLRVGAEYRANWLYIRPVNLTGESQRNANWIEHRLRLDAAVDYDEKVRLVMSLDGLDGVLWGDNGTYLGDPSPNSGTRASAGIPNNARVGIGYLGSGSDIDPNNYGYVLQPAEPMQFRRAYGEVNLPIGLLRIGRQPTNEGTGILVADGDGRPNRFGYSGRGDSSDRILFATKPLEGLKPAAQRDRSRDRGFFFVAFYDNLVENRVQLFGDNVRAAGTALRLLLPSLSHQQRLELTGTYAHRWERDFDTNINIFGLKGSYQLGRFSAGAEVAHVNGATEEVSRALALINNDPIARQDVRQWGARAVARWDEPLWTGYLEFDFASGDRNPNPGTQLTQFYFAEDTNVGLLMFERVLHFQSARSGVAGSELLRQIGATTFPNERLDSEGSFTNAVAIFPQFDLRPLPDLLVRGGVLAAWAPVGLVDPSATLQVRDGSEIEDDLLNYNGGRPGTFYGVELDGRLQWRYERFLFDLEGAIFFPGDVFHDANGRAARSSLVQGRTTFVF